MTSEPRVPHVDCDGVHKIACVGVSSHAVQGSKYRQPTPEQRLAAVSLSGRTLPSQSVDQLPLPTTFPAPLVLPGDEVDEDPEYETQSLCSWAREKERNLITPKRNALYVIEAPDITENVADANKWLKPTIPPKNRPPKSFPNDLQLPQASQVAEYLAAFYHGLEVKSLPSTHYRFVPWTSKRSRGADRIGMIAPDGSVTGIRYRPSPDGVAPQQLNLLDLLDVLDASVPADAYAVVLIVHHDTYETDEDDFCCGRAFGGSRISVVSSFRYNPVLDFQGDVERLHAWPASHCVSFMDYMWDNNTTASKDDPDLLFTATNVNTPMALALKAAKKPVMIPKTASKAGWAAIWLSRVCRTASHELGHCFGMDHCMYYACVMQGVATIAEDARQPPYLCPVCLAKLAFGVSGETTGQRAKARADRDVKEAEWVIERYRRLEAYCATWGDVGLWRTYRAWIVGRLAELSV